MQKDVTISIFEVVGSPLCVASGDGQKVYERLALALKEGRSVSLSFHNVSALTAAFLNAAIGQLYGEFSEEQIRALLNVRDIQLEDLALLKRVVETAKQYFEANEYTEEEAARNFVNTYFLRGPKTKWFVVMPYGKGWCIYTSADALGPEKRGDFEKHLVALEPEEPPCIIGCAHYWGAPRPVVGGLSHSPGIFGDLIKNVCVHCGVYKTDNMNDESGFGHHGMLSVEYAPADSKSLEWIRRKR